VLYNDKIAGMNGKNCWIAKEDLKSSPLLLYDVDGIRNDLK
jgi:hypothetical protein